MISCFGKILGERENDELGLVNLAVKLLLTKGHFYRTIPVSIKNVPSIRSLLGSFFVEMNVTLEFRLSFCFGALSKI